MNKMIIILKLLYFMLPAYFGNMAPVIGKKWLPFLAVPIDMGKKLNKKPILGKNKTWRGLIFAVIASTLIFIIQKYLHNHQIFQSISLIDYSTAPIAIGILLGLGAIAGDSIESFFKRQFNVKPGKPWIPFDQIDFTIGAIALTSIIYFPGWKNSLIIVLISALAHIIVNHIAYFLKIRKEKW